MTMIVLQTNAGTYGSAECCRVTGTGESCHGLRQQMQDITTGEVFWIGPVSYPGRMWVIREPMTTEELRRAREQARAVAELVAAEVVVSRQAMQRSAAELVARLVAAGRIPIGVPVRVEWVGQEARRVLVQGQEGRGWVGEVLP